MNVTIFENYGALQKPHIISLEKALDRIKIGKSKDKNIEIRRKVLAGEDYDIDKKNLPFVVFSAAETIEVLSKQGYMTHREDRCVSHHSGVFAIDFDKVDVLQKKEQLTKDPYILAVWIGPSGKSVKALVKCPPSIENHTLYYTAFLDRYPELDPTSRNIGRGQYESWDEGIWINWNSLVWDKKLTEEQRKKNKEKDENRRGKYILSTAVAMVRSSHDGNKHETLLKAANLLGGYIASGRVKEEEAVKILEEEIRAKNPKDLAGALKTISDGIGYGKIRPLTEAKKIEKSLQFLRREDGSYEFLASEEEMTEYELAVINGTLEMGLPTGLNWLNEHWMFKRHTIVFFGGIDNVGKSFVVWYLAVLAAKFHGWKFCIQSAENNDGELRKKLKEFFMGKSLKVASSEELLEAQEFYKDHFKIISSKNLHSMEDFLLKAELVFDEGFEFEVLIGEPWNSFDIPTSIDFHRNNLHCLNLMRVFKERYSSIWVCDHVGTQAARKKDKEGYVEVPWKSDIDGGTLKGSKTDDFIMVHRVINHPEKSNDTGIHVLKIKSRETGGSPTSKDNPVILKINKDYCGYSCNGIDPIKNKQYGKENINNVRN